MLVAAPVTAIGAPALGRVARRYPAPIPAAAVASLEADLWASLLPWSQGVNATVLVES